MSLLGEAFRDEASSWLLGQLDHALVLEHFHPARTERSDVQMDTEITSDAYAFPRPPVDPDLWDWKVGNKFCWKKPAHISELEMRFFIFPLVASPLHAQSLREASPQAQVDASSHAWYLYVGPRVEDWVAATDNRSWDRQSCICSKDLWLSGEEKLLTGDIIFAVAVAPPRRRFFPRCQVPRRAAPLPVKVVLIFINLEASWSDVWSAALVLLAVHWLLQTGKAVGMQRSQLSLRLKVAPTMIRRKSSPLTTR